MKKTLFVAAVAAMLVFAVAGSAFAVNHTGQQRIGAAFSQAAPIGGTGNVNSVATATAVAGNNVLGAGTYTYQDWSQGIGLISGANNGVSGVNGNATDNSPHGNYATNTVKCAVCHAVHYAAPGNAPGGSSSATADTLLRMRAGAACGYCHASTGTSVNGRPVYEGVFGAGTAPSGGGGGTTLGHAIGTNCNECHTGPHGAGADESVASLAGFLLKNQTNTVGSASTITTNMIGNINLIEAKATAEGFAAGAALGYTPAQFGSLDNTTIKEQAVGLFCNECHNGSYSQVAAGASANINGNTGAAANGALGGDLSGHRIAAGTTSNWNGSEFAGSISSGAYTGTIAWAAAANCKSCHDAKDSFGNDAFPHSWGQDASANRTRMWLLQASDQGAAKTALPENNASPSNYGVGAGQAQLYDGVCLKCHVAAGGAAGVGITF